MSGKCYEILPEPIDCLEGQLKKPQKNTQFHASNQTLRIEKFH